MILFSLTLTHSEPKDLGYLLHKHPDRVQSFDLRQGRATVFYPSIEEQRATFAMLLELDPVGLVRRKKSDGFALEAYVNDRPYVASSFLSSALSQVLSSALNGTCKDRPELVDQAFPIEVQLSMARIGGGAAVARALFEPLGYEVELSNPLLDPEWPEWGDSSYFHLRLRGQQKVQDVLRHLYVLIPVMDNKKHYYVGNHDVDKLLDKGEDWLKDHPEKEMISRRFLKHRPSLTRMAMERLLSEEPAEDQENSHAQEEEKLEKKISLHEKRLDLVLEKIVESGAQSVVDLGCGEGKLLGRLLKQTSIPRILGMDISYRSLEIAKRKLHWDRLSPKVAERIQLIHGALTYKDDRLKDFDLAALVEVIEHLDPARLEALEKALFAHAQPQKVIITTPNGEYNVLFEGLPAGKFRHSDHRFEWSREEFETWASKVAQNFGYSYQIFPVGEVHPEHGAPSQMAIFSRKA